MANSTVNIVNRALLYIHEPPIESLSEDSNSARRALLAWPGTLDNVFRENNWTCLTKRAVLASNGTTEFGDLKRFKIPNDFIAIVSVDDTSAIIEGLEILSTKDTIKLAYTARKTNPNDFSPELQEAISLRLAADLAKTDDVETRLNIYTKFLDDLRYRDAVKNQRTGYANG